MSSCEVEIRVYVVNKDELDNICYYDETVDCPVYAEDRGEYWGVPCSEDVVDIDVAEGRLWDMKKELKKDGFLIVGTELGDEYESEATYDEIREALEMPDLTDEEIDKMIYDAEGVW